MARWAPAAALLACLVLAGCGDHAPSAQDRQLAKDLAATGILVSESMTPLDLCDDEACLRRASPIAAARIHRQLAGLEPRVAQIDSDCLRAATKAFIGASRAYESAARIAAGRGQDAFVQAENHANELASGSFRELGKCAPASARSLALLKANDIIASSIARIDGCSDRACITTEGARLGRLLDEQRRVVDDAYTHEHGCLKATQGTYDRALAAAKRMATAVEHVDETAAGAAADEAAKLFDAGNHAMAACIP